MNDKDKRIAELESALKHIVESTNKSISFEHDLFDKGWNQCARSTIDMIYRLTGLGNDKT